MATPLPIACSLSASDYQQRMREIAALGAEALIERSGEGVRQTLRFRSGERIHERLKAIVAAEASCCAFLDFELRGQGDEHELVIISPEGAEAAAAELAAAFAGG